MNENQTNEQKRAKKQIVCVRPMYGSYPTISSLVEFLVYYRVNGIDHIEFYNYNLSNDLLDVISRNFQHFVSVRQFRYPFNRTLIHSEAQMAAMHDCLYRFYEHIVLFVDVDEFIVPFNYNTVSEFVSDEYANGTQLLASLLISSVFLCDKFNANLTSNESVKIFRNYRRSAQPLAAGTRSKVIVLRPPLIQSLGIHCVWNYVGIDPIDTINKYLICGDTMAYMLWNSNITEADVKYRIPEKVIDVSDALIYHYNPYCDSSEPIVNDTTLLIKYKTPILNYILSNNLSDYFNL